MEIISSIKNGTENLGNILLDLDSRFVYPCKGCSKCCDSEVVLTSRDLFNLAKRLNMKPIDFAKEYAFLSIGEGSGLPVFTFKMDGPRNVCPFLKMGRCSVRGSEPVVCALYPLGRAALPFVDQDPRLRDLNGAVRFFISGNCKDPHGKIYTVREWLLKRGVPERDSFLPLWSDVLLKFSKCVKLCEEKGFDKNAVLALLNGMTIVLYFDYDIEKEFIPQFEDKTKDFISKLINPILEEHGTA